MKENLEKLKKEFEKISGKHFKVDRKFDYFEHGWNSQIAEKHLELLEQYKTSLNNLIMEVFRNNENAAIKFRGKDNGEIYLITPSSRTGVKYQITWIDDRGPKSHQETNELSEICKEVYRYTKRLLLEEILIH